MAGLMVKDIKGKAADRRWRGILKDFQENSLTVEAYARDCHMSRSTLYKWSKRLEMPLKKTSLPSSPLSFVEIKPLEGLKDQVSPLEVFSIEVKVSKGACCFKAEMTWSKMIDFVKAFL
jgi:hypothetical protein